MKMERLVVDIEPNRGGAGEQPISFQYENTIQSFLCPGLPHREPLAWLVQESAPSLGAHGRREGMVGCFREIKNILGSIISGMPIRTPRQFLVALLWKSLV